MVWQKKLLRGQIRSSLEPKKRNSASTGLSKKLGQFGPLLANCNEEELRAKLLQEAEAEQGVPSQGTAQADAKQPEKEPAGQQQSEEVPLVDESGGGGSGNQSIPRTPAAAAWIQANSNRANNRTKLKEISAVTIEQRAAPLKAAAGLAREERLRAARETNANEPDNSVDVEIAERQEEERLHQDA